MASLEIKNIHKAFGSVHAVDGLSLSVSAGEIYALIGPNGSGKTTTIKTIAGVYHPDSGEIRVAGHNAADAPEEAKAALGYIPDEPFVYDRLTGREFLHLVGALFSVSPEDRMIRIRELLELFPLKSIIDGYVENYSRGNKQKLSIIAALLHTPQVLLVDEPIVGLDPESTIKAREVFMGFAKHGGAVLLCTHTLSFAERVAHRIGLLKDGRLVREGTITELRSSARKPDASLEELYLHFTHTDSVV